MTTQTYQQASQRFLAQAKEELAAGDLQQASEKGWGAAAQMLKAIAEQRSWEHGKHRHLSRAASRLRAETGDRDVYRFFSVANDLHGNFYENEMSAEDIAESSEPKRATETFTAFSQWPMTCTGTSTKTRCRPRTSPRAWKMCRLCWTG